MINFMFTNKAIPESSSIRGVAYNANTEELLVSLEHGGSYVYEGVPMSHYSEFVTSDSVGRAFKDIKDVYGPYSQRSDEIELTWVSTRWSPAPGVVPKNLAVTDNTVIRESSAEDRINLVNNYHDESKDARLEYVIVFSDGPYEYSHAVSADSVEDAVDVVVGFGETLGRTFNPIRAMVDLTKEGM